MKKNTYNPDTARHYHINSIGSRSVSIDREGNRETLPVSLDGETVKPRAVRYWEMCGNFSYPVIRVKGKETTIFPDDIFQPTMWTPLAVKQAKDASHTRTQ